MYCDSKYYICMQSRLDLQYRSRSVAGKVGLDGVDPERLVRAVRVRRECKRVRGVERARGPGSEADDAVRVRLDERELALEVSEAALGVAAALQDMSDAVAKSTPVSLTVSESRAWRPLLWSQL
jgi:hypothetical protein